MSKLTAIFAGILLASGALAQDSSAGEDLAVEEPLRHYTVEIIVFAYTEDVSVGTEIFLPDAPPPVETPPVDAEESVPEYGDFATSDPTELEDEEPPPTWVVVPQLEMGAADDDEADPFRLVLLTEDEFTLGDAIDRFDRLDAYETMMHVGWTQPAFPEEETPAIELALLGTAPEGLNGTFTLYLSRYLHLVVDLSLDAPEAFEQEVIEDDSFFRFGDSRQQFDDEPEPFEPVVRFRIQEDRILKNGELRYFDHPRFGVLAKVMRVEEAESDPLDEDGAQNLARRP